MKENTRLPAWAGPPLFMAAVFVLYGHTLRYPFIYDDMWTIVANLSIRSLFPISKFFLDAATAALPASGIPGDVYRPLSTLSFAMTNALFGLHSAAFRFFGLLVHAANGFLLWKILQRRTAAPAAFLGALFFIVHPVQVESVAWITQRSILICALGCLAAFHAWDLAEKNPRRAWLATIFFAVALLGKETALGLPLLWFASLKNVKDKRLPAAAACVPVGAAYLLLRQHVLGRWTQAIQRTETVFSSLADGMVALARYAESIFFPFRLNVSYRWPESVSFATPRLWAGLLIFAGLALCALYCYRRRPTVFLGLAAFLVFWLPHSGVVPLVTFAADRFLYLPLAGVAFVVADFLTLHPRLRSVAGVFVIALAFVAFRRTRVWENEKTLWRSSVQTDGRNSFALMCYGMTMERDGNDGEAEAYYKRSLSNRPRIGLAREVLTMLLKMSERRGDADGVRLWKEKLATVPAE